MTNIFKTQEKVDLGHFLFQTGIDVLERDGWTVERVQSSGLPSLRRISKAGKSYQVAIKKTQDTYLAFARNKADTEWATLSEVDFVVVVSVDNRENPKFANVHMLDAADVRDRFDRAYAARRVAGHRIPVGRGVWIPLYLPDATSPPAQVGGGLGLENQPIAQIPLQAQAAQQPKPELAIERAKAVSAVPSKNHNEPSLLSIPEAKRQLALALGVDVSSIRITVEA
jgi:hypothetical protein